MQVLERAEQDRAEEMKRNMKRLQAKIRNEELQVLEGTIMTKTALVVVQVRVVVQSVAAVIASIIRPIVPMHLYRVHRNLSPTMNQKKLRRR